MLSSGLLVSNFGNDIKHIAIAVHGRGSINLLNVITETDDQDYIYYALYYKVPY